MKCRNLVKGLLFLVAIALIAFTTIGLRAAQEQEFEDFPYYRFRIKKVAILPFADRSHRDFFGDAMKWKGNRRVVSEISRSLKENKVEVITQDKIVESLLRDGAIKQLEQSGKFSTLMHEITHFQHGERMTGELFRASTEGLEGLEPTTALTTSKIIELGEEWGVDTIIRGTIFHYEIRGREIKEPFAGLIPFLMCDGEREIMSYAISRKYETGILKPGGVTSVHDYKMEFPRSEDASAIAIALFAQDAETGEVFWSDCVEVGYPSKRFNRQLKKKISRLFRDMFTKAPNFGYLYVGE